jgi:large subunit ribosomal protein L4
MALTAQYIDKDNTASLDEAIFDQAFHPSLVHEVVRAERNALRRGTASTKTRGEIEMTGGKAWRQKGTGRARAGALSTPQRTGGGVAFGPKPRRYTIKVNRKQRRRALRAVLSAHARRGSLALVDPQSFADPSTRQAYSALSTHNHTDTTLLVVAPEGEDGCLKSFRNLSHVSVLTSDRVGVSDIVSNQSLVLSESALETLTRLAADRQGAEVSNASA